MANQNPQSQTDQTSTRSDHSAYITGQTLQVDGGMLT